MSTEEVLKNQNINLEEEKESNTIDDPSAVLDIPTGDDHITPSFLGDSLSEDQRDFAPDPDVYGVDNIPVRPHFMDEEVPDIRELLFGDHDRPQERIIYKLLDGRMWDTSAAKWIDVVPNDGGLVTLMSADGTSNEEYLLDTLKFYHYPLGEFTSIDPDTIRTQLLELDTKYLTPRVLGGLATDDAYAQKQWALHEAEAEPLRQQLKELEQES